MKISFFIGSMGMGGAERVISILANHYSKKGWDVDIVLLLENKVGYVLHNNVSVVDLAGKSSSYYKNLPFWFRSIRKYLKNRKPDRIVSFVGRINALVLASSIGLKVPVIVSERNDPRHDGRSKFMLSLCNKLYKSKAASVVFQTEYESTCFTKKIKGKSYVIGNPIEVNEELGTPDGNLIVTAGRLIAQKNHAMLIDAVALLKNDFPDIKAIIYGSGNLETALNEKISKLGLSDTVNLGGSVKDIHRRIKNSAVFVMTSEFEGLSNALIEAMTLALPCISTDYPGVSEIISDGENGLIVPRGNSEALANAIRTILKDRELREKLSQNAKKTSENYKTDVVIGKWEAVIEKPYGVR